MVTRTVKIETVKQETIRARLYTPPSSSTSSPYKAVVLAHPYHHYGGNYNNHVVCSLATLLESLGYLVITFNFRRRKASWSGHTEMEDMRCTIDWLLHRPGHEAVSELIIGGYSYGALVASAVSPHPISDRDIRLSYLLISMPLLLSKYYLWMFPKPRRVYKVHRTLAIWGSEDEFAPMHRVKRKSGRAKLHVAVLDSCPHFIEDDDHKAAMLEFIARWVDGAEGDDLRTTGDRRESNTAISAAA
ncbi:hypothetical protein MRB53_039133 [Persea americana]|nr:hypothetical protein MRB53_039133 [Persea americana]